MSTTRIILQPASNKVAQQNYQKTITTPVPLAAFTALVAPDMVTHCAELYPNGLIPTWGCVPSNKEKWAQFKPGDIVLFSAEGKIFSSATVTHKFRSSELGGFLWSCDDKGQIYEYIYLLDEVRSRSIPYKDLNGLLGYSDKNVIMGLSVLTQQQSESVLAAFPLASDVYLPEVTEDEFHDAVCSLEPTQPLASDMATDAVVRSKARKEQNFLRRYLFQNRPVGTCGICGCEYPVGSLVAAHIKKRAKCSAEERLDYKNIVMSMCKFGCDEMYEKGYIAIKDGVVVALANSAATPSLATRISHVSGKAVKHWNDNTIGYFVWHHDLWNR